MGMSTGVKSETLLDTGISLPFNLICKKLLVVSAFCSTASCARWLNIFGYFVFAFVTQFSMLANICFDDVSKLKSVLLCFCFGTVYVGSLYVRSQKLPRYVTVVAVYTYICLLQVICKNLTLTLHLPFAKQFPIISQDVERTIWLAKKCSSFEKEG